VILASPSLYASQVEVLLSDSKAAETGWLRQTFANRAAPKIVDGGDH
jgi:hypothetical protein